MHQQVRSSTRKKPAGDGPGTPPDQGSLLDLLRTLEEAGVNMQAAGGHDLDQGGEFAFSVHHDWHGDTPDDTPYDKAVAALEAADYEPRIIKTLWCDDVRDKAGGLLACIRNLQAEGVEPDEVFIGTPNKRGLPVQITTEAAVRGDAPEQSESY